MAKSKSDEKSPSEVSKSGTALEAAFNAEQEPPVYTPTTSARGMPVPMPSPSSEGVVNPELTLDNHDDDMASPNTKRVLDSSEEEDLLA